MKKLFCEIDEEDLSVNVEKGRAVIAADNFIFSQKTNIEFFTLFHQEFPALVANKPFMDDLRKFVHTIPRLPSSNKSFSHSTTVELSTNQTRKEIIHILSGLRQGSVTVDLAFYAGRQMGTCDWQPFLKAAFERNPVSVDFFKDMEVEKVYWVLSFWPDESIYEENGMAMPDEVVNYRRGSGIEKAVTFINVAKSRHLEINQEIHYDKIIIKINHQRFEFLVPENLMIPNGLV
jgi:hypothetical protein